MEFFQHCSQTILDLFWVLISSTTNHASKTEWESKQTNEQNKKKINKFQMKYWTKFLNWKLNFYNKNAQTHTIQYTHISHSNFYLCCWLQHFYFLFFLFEESNKKVEIIIMTFISNFDSAKKQIFGYHKFDVRRFVILSVDGR